VDSIIANVSAPTLPHRPLGISLIACAYTLIAAFLLLTGVFAFLGRLPLAAAAPLLGGLEIMGPFIFLICAAVATVTAVGLLLMKPWARRLASLLCVALLVPAVTAISTAVVDLRLLAIVREALRFIVAIAAFRYLSTESVREQFSESVH
jgi:hypothetical protein